MQSNVAALQTTDKRVRRRLIEAAAHLMAQKGLSSDLLKDAAAIAECPFDRAKIYFQRNEDLVLAIYVRLAADLESRALELPEGKLGVRFKAAMIAKMSLVEPYKQAFRRLIPTFLDSRHELGIFNEQTEIIRNSVIGVFSKIILGSSDCPASFDPPVYSIYAAHLALMFLYTLDRTPGALVSRVALNLACGLIYFAGLLLSVPGGPALLQTIDKKFVRLSKAEQDASKAEQAEKVLRRLFRYRRLLPNAGDCADNPCERCLALHRLKALRFINAGEPIHFLLPAFPAKSPNRRKTLGSMPDMAEETALLYLQNVCNEIKEIYPPGAAITICSDGRVFSDLVGVSDKDVTDYGNEIRNMIDRLGAKSLDGFSLEDLFDTDGHDAMRAHLCDHYAERLDVIETRSRVHEHHRALFNGIHRFLFEDGVVLEPNKSRTQVRNESKERTYQVIQRSDAWGRLIGDCFPTALRLSIHPQSPHSEKIGIRLADADDIWLTPWHAVAVKQGGHYRLMQRHDAEELNARIVERAGRPICYEVIE